jgi:gliding motility-associated-like protein
VGAVAYNQTLSSSGGTAPYSYSLLSGALPIGMSFNSAGVFSGVPRSAGSFSLNVRSTDAFGSTATQLYTFTINPPVLILNPASLPDAVIGVVYNQNLSTSGGIASYSYSILSGTLPIGMSFNSAGLLSGTITVPGTFNVNIKSTDDAGFSVTKLYTIVVQRKTQTINMAGTAAANYGDADIDPGAVSNGGLTISYTSSDAGIATIVAGKVHITGSGQVSIFSDQAGDATYAPAVQKQMVLTVAKAVLTYTATPISKIYGAVTPALTGGLSGFKYSDNAGATTGTTVFTTSAGLSSGIGTYPITGSGLTAANYTFVQAAGNATALSITPKAVTVAAEAKTKGYGDVDPPLTFSVNPAVVTGDSFTGALNRIPGEGIGTYVINKNTLALNANYTLSYAGANLTVNKAVLTVTVDGKQMCQGGDVPTLTVTYTGFKYSDAAGSLSIVPQLSSTGDKTSMAGNYVLSASGAAAANYTFNYVNGVLQINALPVLAISGNKGSSISKGETALLSASGATTYVWTANTSIISGQNTAVLTVRPKETTTYTVTGTNATECSQTRTFTLNVLDDMEKLKATNIITPNNDGFNDKWVVDNIDFYPDNEVKIFDKGGRVVFSKKGYDNSWDGTWNGTALAEDTYYYVIDFMANKRKIRGYITLLRAN